MMLYENKLKNISYPYKSAVMNNDAGFMKHCHQELEIMFILKGELKASNDDEVYKLHQGDMMIFLPFENHSLFKPSDYCERLVVQLDLELINMGMKNQKDHAWLLNELNGIELYSGYWSEQTKKTMEILITSMHQEYVERGNAWQLAISNLIGRLILTALRDMPHREVKKENKQIEKLKDILEYISQNYTNRITLKECADTIGFNSTYFSRFFSKHMEMTFQEYVKNLRIENAKWLLVTEQISVSEVCYLSGYNDVKTFNKHFRDICGQNPTQFRNDSKIR